MTNYDLLYSIGVLFAIIVPAASIYKEDKTLEVSEILLIIGFSGLSWLVVIFYVYLILQENKRIKQQKLQF